MIIDNAGTYTLRYTATDECGKTTTVDRELVVEVITCRTVLYQDGTFIINEPSNDASHNIELHGAETNVYAPFDPNGVTDAEKYIFASASERPWHNEASSITSVEIGSNISPTSTNFWFIWFRNCTEINLSKLDTSNVTSMAQMFDHCESLTSLDVSSFDTSDVTNMYAMFRGCSALTKIFASANFVVTQVTDSSSMFGSMSTNLVGGSGTVWNFSKTGKTYAHIDGGTSNPGYFTAKS